LKGSNALHQNIYKLKIKSDNILMSINKFLQCVPNYELCSNSQECISKDINVINIESIYVVYNRFLIFFFKTDKFFRVQRPPGSSFFSIFSLLYEIQINCLCIQRPSMHSFSYFFFHVFEVEIILFCRQRLSVSSFSSILLVFLFVAPNKHQYQGQETCYIQHIYFLYLLHLCLC
jgi:hypothetical protein